MKKGYLKKAGCSILLSMAMLLPAGAAAPVMAAEAGETLPALQQIAIGPENVTTNAGDTSKLYSLFDGGRDSNGYIQGLGNASWFAIDFVVPVKVEQVYINTGSSSDPATDNKNGIKKVTFQVSDDGRTWSDVGTANNENADGTTILHNMGTVAVDSPQTARYFRINLTKVGDYSAKVYELQFYSSDAGNLALNKRIVSHSNYYQTTDWADPVQLPTSLIDGDFTTNWKVNGGYRQSLADDPNQNPHEVIIDLGKFYQLKRWAVVGEGYNWWQGYFGPHQFTLSYLSANPGGEENWIPFVTNEFDSTDTRQVVTRGGTVEDEVLARYVKIESFRSGHGGEAYSTRIFEIGIKEFQLFGDALADEAQANLIATPVSVPLSDLDWDYPDTEKFRITKNADSTNINCMVYNGTITSTNLHVTNGFDLPEGFSLEGTQKIDFTFSKDSTEGAKGRVFRISLNEENENYGAEIYLKAGTGDETFSIPTDCFLLEDGGTGDGKLDLTKVAHIDLTAYPNVKEGGETYTVTDLKDLTVHKGVPVAVQSPIRLETLAADEEADGESDVVTDGTLAVKENLFADNFNTGYDLDVDATSKLYNSGWTYADAKENGILQVQSVDGSNVLFLGKEATNVALGPLTQFGFIEGIQEETIQISFRFKPYNQTAHQFKITVTDTLSHYVDFIYVAGNNLTFCGVESKGVVKLNDWNHVKMIFDFKNKVATLYFNNDTVPFAEEMDITDFLTTTGLDTSKFNVRVNAWIWGSDMVGYYVDDFSIDQMELQSASQTPETPEDAPAFKAGDIKVIGDIKNLDVTDKEYLVFAGLYENIDGNDKLVDVATEKITAAYGVINSFALPLTVTEDGDYTVKAYVWCNGSLLPINAVHVFE